MTSHSDDDALSWEGDDALEARRPAPPTVPADRGRVGGVQHPVSDAALARDSAPDTTSDAADEPAGMSTVTLLLLGIFGGIYLLYTVGWIIGGVGMQAKAMFMLPAPFYLASMWIAVLAPALWFTAALVMTRQSKSWVRVAALVLGVLLLVPWPFVTAGGGAL